ncbi:hypothetical protein L1887_38247 [Cichorium endivia]|nr:hypothetical protein L1887_38247 [Cichorium endivia]
MDEEELLKRFTDCVYFLASPLTCKKGIECEYRHNEIARLNPRDCWYWLGGCCFNPDCAFRHPPLEGLKEAYHEPSTLNNTPMDKTNIPCYFYSKGFCNKGDKCSFLHSPADVSIPLKPSKPTSMVKNPIPCEKKLSAESNTNSPPIKSHQNPSETAEVEHTNTVGIHTQDSDQESSESTDISESQSQGNSIRSNSSVQHEEFVQSESDVFNDQSSGFDVLVEGESERLGFDFDQGVDFFSDHEEEGEDRIGYDPSYPEMENGFVKERFDVYDGLDKGQSRKSIFYRLSFKKRNLEYAPIFNGRKSHDLREHLKRRRVVDVCFSQGYDRNFRKYPPRKAVPVNRYRKPQFVQQKKRYQEKGEIFKGPKSLEEIKEEKKNSLYKKDGFQGPRSLSEILKNKRKVG